jgi:hypothetical protein
MRIDRTRRRRVGRGLLLGYLVVCVLAALLVGVVTGWPLTSLVLLLAVFYALMVTVGAVILRPLAEMASVIVRSTRNENRRDLQRPTRGFRRRGATGTAPAVARLRRRPGADVDPAPQPPVADHRA